MPSKNTLMLSILRKLEWSGISREDFGHHDYSAVPCCLACGNLNYYEPYTHLNKGHKSDCELRIAIEELQT
jgi:hypothetical protein